MVELFDRKIAENLAGEALSKAKQHLVSSLRRSTGLHLLEHGDTSAIHCTEVYYDSEELSPYDISWRGFIGTSDCRDDGMFVYGAHLFPLLDMFRVYLSRTEDQSDTMPFSFRYLLLTPEEDWKDLGGQVDENGEFEHWYRNEV